MSKIKLNMEALKPKKQWIRHKITDGDNIVRFCPPFNEDANGYPYFKYNVVWGLIDPSSGRMKPYASPVNTEKKCPVYEYVDLLTAKLKKEEAIMLAGGATEKNVRDRFKDVNEFIGRIRPKGTYAYNAVDQSGTLGILELKKTAHEALMKLMDKYITDYNQDPTSLNSDADDSGVWFNITRAGKGFDTKYGALKNQIGMKNERGTMSYEDDRTPLSDNVVENFDELGYDLAKLYKAVSYLELKDILVANINHHVKEGMTDLIVEGFVTEDAAEDVPTIDEKPSQEESVDELMKFADSVLEGN